MDRSRSVTGRGRHRRDTEVRLRDGTGRTAGDHDRALRDTPVQFALDRTGRASTADTCWDHQPLTDAATHADAAAGSSTNAVRGGQFMVKFARRVGIAFGSFVIAWLAVSLVAGWLFGSGNVLVWVIAAVVGAGVYLDIVRRDQQGRPAPIGHRLGP